MLSYLLFLIAVAPLIASGAIAYLYSQSLFSLVGVLVGTIVGAILILISGVSWLYKLQKAWMESQAVGFIFLPVILPFYAYIGAIAGSSLVAILYSYSRNHEMPLLFPIVAIALTAVLGGLMPAAIAALPDFATTEEDSRENNNLAFGLILAMGIGIASALLASALAYFLLACLYHFRTTTSILNFPMTLVGLLRVR
ncbi:hypothetical protein [Geitlerinema sp. PCC 9228]|jgi:MFS family permease|uniref:hypothetical protein n=1 Tax=Geitlerinema sp. PCC 9228 TaxID=111611 RepID=UPI0008F99997|nr:hypothetical protein [Geitlerinema sp. PCC 9228]